MSAREAALAAGLPERMTYTPRETSEYTGIPYETLLGDIRSGRLRAYVPRGRRRGYRIRPEWVDEWLEEVSRGDS